LIQAHSIQARNDGDCLFVLVFELEAEKVFHLLWIEPVSARSQLPAIGLTSPNGAFETSARPFMGKIVGRNFDPEIRKTYAMLDMMRRS
jgi:hypothetical protein